MNVTLDAPAGMVTDDGMVAFGLLEVNVTTRPPVAAGPVKVTVPVEGAPPGTVLGETAKLERVGGATAIVAVKVDEASLAEIVAVVDVETAFVLIGNVAVTAPAGTVAEPGTVTLVLFDERLTVVPLGGAIPFRVTVPVEVEPPITEVGETVNVAKAVGLIVKAAALVIDPIVAVIFAVVTVGTPSVLIETEAVMLPSGTVTEATIGAAAVSEANAITAPPVPAGLFKLTVAVEVPPPITLVGARVRLCKMPGPYGRDQIPLP